MTATSSYTATSASTSASTSTSIPVSPESSYGSSSSAVLHSRTSTPLTMRTKHKAVVHEPEMPPQYAHSYFSEDELQTDLDPDLDLDLDTDIDTASHSHADAGHTSRTFHLLRRSSSFSTHQQPSLRARLVALASGRQLPPSSRHQHPRGISTGRGVFCAGETETEGEDLHVRHVRIVHSSHVCLLHLNHADATTLSYRSLVVYLPPGSYLQRRSSLPRIYKPGSHHYYSSCLDY
jgi:hypothetical protein